METTDCSLLATEVLRAGEKATIRTRLDSQVQSRVRSASQQSRGQTRQVGRVRAGRLALQWRLGRPLRNTIGLDVPYQTKLLRLSLEQQTQRGSVSAGNAGIGLVLGVLSGKHVGCIYFRPVEPEFDFLPHLLPHSGQSVGLAFLLLAHYVHRGRQSSATAQLLALSAASHLHLLLETTFGLYTEDT